MVFDASSVGDVQYVLLFATYPSEDDRGYSTAMFGFSPFENEDRQDAAEYISFANFVRSVFGKSICNVTAFTGDNCKVKKAFCRKIGVPLLGCASYRFCPAVSEILSVNSEIVNVVHKLMSKCKTQTIAAKLRRNFALHTKTNHVTRWSSTCEKFERYITIPDHIRDTQVEGRIGQVEPR